MLNNNQEGQILLTDKEVAHRIGISVSWMRQQRFKMRRGQPHNFDVKPRMIGTSPRYLSREVDEWIELLPVGTAYDD
jgi:predicted DNA-binding transcriptional regulator AlpA